jgi:hypothetical protein
MPLCPASGFLAVATPRYVLHPNSAATASSSAAPPPLAEHPEWIQLRALLMLALDPFPDARASVLSALDQARAEGRLRSPEKLPV